MLDLIIAAALIHLARDPCHAVPRGDTHRSCPLWRSTSRNARFETFINPGSVARSGATFEISIRIVYATELPGSPRSGVARYRYDCANRTSATLHLTEYDSAGIVIGDRDTGSDEARPRLVIPGSTAETLLAEFCPR